MTFVTALTDWFIATLRKKEMELTKILEEDSARIIDVRTREEFSGGHVLGSENIPLNELVTKMEEYKGSKGPIVFCCASGNRSGQATYYFQTHGVERVYNGGSWLDVNYAVSLKEK